MLTKKRKKETAKTGSSLASMIDVVFLLLFFFVATFVPQKVEAHLAIDHPTSSGTPSTMGPKMEVQVRPQGYMWMDRWKSLEEIEDKLMGVAVLDETVPVFIKVHPSATEGQLVKFLDICGKLGITKLNVLTLKE
ncbi:hypothetical protein BVY04_00635 [bacterium M21]|nr:hypothetical protein BVY04_00635 [bacterium M21]